MVEKETQNCLYEITQELLLLQEDLADLHRTCAARLGDAVTVLEAAQDRCDALLWLARNGE